MPSTYIPPDPFSVDFVVNTELVIPDYDKVDFDLIGDNTIIRIKKCVMYLNADPVYFMHGSILRTDFAILYTHVNALGIQEFNELAISKSISKSKVSANILQLLPDCIPSIGILMPNGAMATLRKPREFDLPAMLTTHSNQAYSGNNILDEMHSHSWKEAAIIDDRVIFSTVNPIAIDNGVFSGWDDLSIIDRLNNISFSQIDALLDSTINDSWISFFWVDSFSTITYSGLYPADAHFRFTWDDSIPNDVFKSYGIVENNNTTDEHILVPWGGSTSSDVFKNIPWDNKPYYTLCQYLYYAPPAAEVKFDARNGQISSEEYNDLFDHLFGMDGWNSVRYCPTKQHFSGGRDPYIDWNTNINLRNLYIPKECGVYYMLNTVTVKRLPDNIPIEVTSISIKYDRESWLWQFSLTIGKNKSQYLDLIKPNPDNADIFTDIEIYINGWKFTCRVESWRESRVFAKDSWTIEGRSPSMALGSPQNPKTNYIFDSNGTAPTAGGQIIDAVLDGTMLGIPNIGWSMDWTYYNDLFSGFDPFDAAVWGIPAGKFEWTGKTQIEVIQTLIKSVGAFIITDPDTATNKKLYARPKYDYPPWYWNTANVYRPTILHSLSAGVGAEIGRSFKSIDTFNAVYVMGQKSSTPQKENSSDGVVVVEAYRSGFGPSARTYGSDIVDQYIFNWQVATELGRMALCNTGEWITHTMRFMSLAEKSDPTPSVPRLLIPGDFVQVLEKSVYWYGTIISVSVDVSVQNGATIVYQTVEIEQYIGN